MFGILLTNRPLERAHKDAWRLYLTASLPAWACSSCCSTSCCAPNGTRRATLTEPQSNLAGIGKLLFADYLLPFELSGLTLLLCLVGAAYLVRRKER